MNEWMLKQIQHDITKLSPSGKRKNSSPPGLEEGAKQRGALDKPKAKSRPPIHPSPGWGKEQNN